MKQTTVIAATIAAVNAKSCCSSKKDLAEGAGGLKPVTKDWVCDSLRPEYE